MAENIDEEIVRNPLDVIRRTVLADKPDHDALAERIRLTIKNVHAAYLFHSKGKPALAALCQVMSSTPNNIAYTTWKDLAESLGLTWHQIGCIENYIFEDSTEMCIKTYAQKQESTIEAIIYQLKKLKRYDAITSVNSKLQDLADFVKQEHDVRPEDIDHGYHSLTNVRNYGLYIPAGYHQLQYQLPITLRKLMEEPTYQEPVTLTQRLIETTHQPQFHEASRQRSIPTSRPRRKKLHLWVMLSFAEDGAREAKEVSERFIEPRTDGLTAGVLILDNIQERVLSNPERFITHAFDQVDYVIPILTPGYFSALGKHQTPFSEGNWQPLDAQYLVLIHDLMSRHYTSNACRNDKVRCVIPNQHIFEVLQNKHWKLDPILRAYVPLSELHTLVNRLFKAKKFIS